MKYYKSKKDVYAFSEDGSQDDFITNDLIEMNDDEVNRHLYPQNYLTDDEKYQIYISSLPSLTRRQFMRTLIDFELDETVEASIQNIKDIKQRKIISCEYRDSYNFERMSELILTMSVMLNLNEKKLNEMWEYGLKL